jgi:hypothetical protein
MKKNIYAPFAPVLILFGLLLTLTGCTDILEPPVAPAKTGVWITVSDGTAERTLLPEDEPNITKYVLEFKDSGTATYADYTIPSGKTAVLDDLPSGNWTITANGYIVVGGSDALVASGKNNTPLSYTAGTNRSLNIQIDPVKTGGNGTFTYAVTVPAIKTATLNISPYKTPTGTDVPEITLALGPNTDSVSLSPGNYLMIVRLDKDDGAYATDTEIVQIYSNLETKYTKIFTDDDFTIAEADTVINIKAIEGVDPPVNGETPATAIDETAQYTGSVSWSPNHAIFAGSTEYTATITLTAKQGFTLTGVAANFFTVAGTSPTATNAADSGAITAKFPATGPTTVPVKVGDDTQNVTLTVSGAATVAYISGGYRAVTTGNYSPFAWFTVDLGTDKSISDFEKVTFDYRAVEGDVGWKGIYLLAGNNNVTLTSGETSPWMVSGVYWGQGPNAIPAPLTAIIGQNKGSSIATLPTAEEEIKFGFYLHSEAATYEISNIVFIPLPEGHIPVTEINGVPDVGEINVEVDLTGAAAGPAGATNKTIVWSVTTAGAGVALGPLADGKFTPTAVGTVTVTATITNGLTESTDYTEEFEIAIRSVPEAKQIALVELSNSYSYTIDLDVDGYGFDVTGGVNYQGKAATFTLNLGTATLKDVVKVTFDYTPVAGDYNFKPIHIVAGMSPDGFPAIAADTLAGHSLGSVQTGGTTLGTPKPLEIVLNYTKAKAISGNTVEIGFVVEAPASAQFRIDNIKFYIAE